MNNSVDPKKCSMCHENLIKYTCPRCSMRTCSLSCCVNHKKMHNCNGQRDKTSFKSLNEMKDLDLLSDYCFLEEINRKIETNKRDEFGNKMKSFNQSTHYQKLIKNKLKMLGTIQILYLPRFSTKHKQNRIWYDRKMNDIFWHIECRFYNQSFYSWTITNLPTDQAILANILEKFSLHCSQLKLENVFTDIEQISVYIENFGQKRKIFGKYEKRPLNNIVDILRERIFIEYPTLLITLTNNENQMIENLLEK